MTNEETRDALIAICETLKAEFRYLTALQGQLGWLDTVVRKAAPEIVNASKSPYTFLPHPATDAQIRLIDELLEKLGKA